ncbi:RNA-directed DNA polymerase, eukaryota [Tanacetum coccineum]
MENIDHFNIKLCWGNYGFDSIISPSVGNSVDTVVVRKFNHSIYAPQDLLKETLWEIMSHVRIPNWKGEIVVMGDFNEVRSPNERYGFVFNSQGANIFNQFISSAGLEELPLGGCKYT